MTERIHVLVPVHNRRETTRSFVECLIKQTYPHYHLILVDDGSSDGTAEMVRERVRDATVIRGNGRWWWAGSLQKGLDWLKAANVPDGDVVLFINDDVLFGHDYLDRAIEVLRHNPASMVLSRLLDRETGEVRESGVHADFRKMTFTVASASPQINCLSTRGLFIRWPDVRRIGDFHPRALPHYLSDYEYTIRGHRRGLACVTSESLALEMDMAKTGFRDFGQDGFGAFVRRYFSNRSASNPVHWSMFMLLAAPFPWKLVNVIRVWKGAAKAFILKATGHRQ